MKWLKSPVNGRINGLEAGVPLGRQLEGIVVKKAKRGHWRIRTGLFRVTTALAALASTAAIASAASTPSFMGLGTTSTCRYPTVAFGVSADGSTVVGRCQNNTGNGQFIAFRWIEDLGNVALCKFNRGQVKNTTSGAPNGSQERDTPKTCIGPWVPLRMRNSELFRTYIG